jgi:hypothetical protein
MREPGRDLSREIAVGEAVEHELDAFISRRHEQRRKSEPERELEALKAKHRAALLADFTATRRENAAEMARLAPELSSRYGQDFALADIVKKLTPPPEAVESFDAPRNTTTVIGIQTMETVAGVPRGTIEQVLGHLAGLAREFEEPEPMGGEG